MTALSFTIPTLGGQSLSSNAPGRKRHPLAVAAAKDALGEAAYFAVLAEHGPQVPSLTPPVDVLLDFYIAHGKRPGDGLYRFEDPSNGGGDVAKPVLDYGVVKTGIIPDDSYLYVRYFVTHVEHVEDLASEKIVVTVREVEEGESDAAREGR